MGAAIGGGLALLVSALANALINPSPLPPVAEKQPPLASPSAGPRVAPQPDSPEATPTPVPDRNEIRLPIPPPKSEPVRTSVQPPDPWTCDSAGRTLFMQAAGQADIPRMEGLLGQGADVNQMDGQAHTALFYAIRAQSVPTVDWLLGHGADPDMVGCDGGTPLTYGLETWNLAVIEPLLWARAPRSWCPATREALYAAVRTKDRPMIRSLLAAHWEPPTLEDSRQPLLAYTLVWGTVDQFFLLLECGVDPNTPLESPVDKSFAQWIKNRSFREYLESDSGFTVLMVAAAQGRLDCVQALLACGARRSAHTGRCRMTAMDFASRYDASPEMLQVLLGKSPRQEDQKMWVDVSINRQRAVFYKDGQVAMVTPVSTGKPGYPTPTGRFVVTDKDKLRMSSIYHGACMPYFMRMSCRDFGMHAGVVPGYPASHGCIRLPYDSAMKLFREVEVGTLVTISQ